MYKRGKSSGVGRPQLRFVELPFYDVEQVLILPTELSAKSFTNDNVHVSDFIVPPQFYDHLRASNAQLPRYEVQMRMGFVQGDEEQPDAYPNNLTVTVNNINVKLPIFVSIPQRGSHPLQKRESRPIDLTTACMSQPPNSNLRLQIVWNQNKTVRYFIAVSIVHHLSAQNLVDRMAPRQVEHQTRDMIRRALGGSEEEIAMDSLRISLLCPLVRTKIKMPGRSTTCTHLQCFDVNNYILMNATRPTWKCPCCGKHAAYKTLVHDNYFAAIVQQTGDSVHDIELTPNLEWRVFNVANPAVLIIDDVTEILPIVSTTTVSTSNTTSSSEATPPAPERSSPEVAPPKSAGLMLDVITLGDSTDSEEETSDESDEEEEQDEEVHESNGKPNRKRKFPQSSGRGRIDPNVITLDSDTDEEESGAAGPLATSTQ